MIPCDMSTRWNSTYDMLEFAIPYRDAIDSVTGNRTMKMRPLKLSNSEWKILTKLRDSLKVSLFCSHVQLVLWLIFKDATLFFSQGTPSISTVIPAMDHIDKHLASAAAGATYSSAMCAALSIGKHTLNWYYNKTDHSEVYCIAMGEYSYPLNRLNSHSNHITPPSLLQASILQECWMGGRVDHHGTKHHLCWVWSHLCFHGHWWHFE